MTRHDKRMTPAKARVQVERAAMRLGATDALAYLFGKPRAARRRPGVPIGSAQQMRAIRVRAWAECVGLDVAPRGRIAAAVYAAYDKAHPGGCDSGNGRADAVTQQAAAAFAAFEARQ